MISIQDRLAINDLFNDYSFFLDEDRLEDWLELFIPECNYSIMPRENLELGLRVTLMLCENKDMLRDRIVSLRQANEFNIHRDKHLISNVKIQGSDDGDSFVTANYAIFQSDFEGNGSLFSFGHYDAQITMVNDQFKFSKVMAVVDNWSIPHMLSTPI